LGALGANTAKNKGGFCYPDVSGDFLASTAECG
jgi:hypothetical protein